MLRLFVPPDEVCLLAERPGKRREPEAGFVRSGLAAQTKALGRQDGIRGVHHRELRSDDEGV
jgi:hypothetical protein